MTKPNFLFITADQWRGDCLSCVDHELVKTPHLDDIASQGVLFKRHYSNAVPCGPSRASLHTGMYLHNHRSGTNGTPLDKRFTNWAIELRNAGYDPALFGYTHTAQDPRYIDKDDHRLNTDEGILPGIKPVIDMATHCPDWRRYLASKGYELPAFDGALFGQKMSESTEQNAHSKNTHSNKTWPNKDIPTPSLYDAADTDTAFLTNSAMAYIEAHTQNNSQSEPWAVHLSLRAPHPPWVAPAPYHERYALNDLPEPIRHHDLEAEQATHPWLAAHLDVPRNRSHAVENKHQKLQASYYGLMNEVDDHMGRLVAHLKALGEWDNTVFVFTSDHGEQMGDHWMYGKAGFFEQSYHIPLIVCAPGAQPSVCEAFTEHVDWLPTCMDFAGIEVPRQSDGKSLRPWLEGDDVSGWRTQAHYEYDFRHSEAESTLGLEMDGACLNVVRDNRYKYVHFAELPCLLFDMRNDPGELNNIASKHPDLVASYAQKLLSWRLASTDKTLSHFQIVRDEGLFDRRSSPAVN